eukprot:5534966-Prymnesium_polylepis.1
MEERNSKGFNAKFKPQHVKKPISQLYHMNKDLSPTETLTSGTDELLSTASGYYEALMSEK